MEREPYEDEELTNIPDDTAGGLTYTGETANVEAYNAPDVLLDVTESQPTEAKESTIDPEEYVSNYLAADTEAQREPSMYPDVAESLLMNQRGVGEAINPSMTESQFQTRYDFSVESLQPWQPEKEEVVEPKITKSGFIAKYGVSPDDASGSSNLKTKSLTDIKISPTKEQTDPNSSKEETKSDPGSTVSWFTKSDNAIDQSEKFEENQIPQEEMMTPLISSTAGSSSTFCRRHKTLWILLLLTVVIISIILAIALSIDDPPPKPTPAPSVAPSVMGSLGGPTSIPNRKLENDW